LKRRHRWRWNRRAATAPSAATATTAAADVEPTAHPAWDRSGQDAPMGEVDDCLDARGLDRAAGKVGGFGEVSEWPKERDWKSRTW
jgi:hypothetical protein